MMASILSPWNFGFLSPQVSGTVSKFSHFSNGDHKSRTWTLHRYPSLRSPESVLPKPMEILADAEKYTSFRGMKDTFTILAAFGFLKTVERSTSFVDGLPLLGNASLIMKRVTASFVPYLAEETKQEKNPAPKTDKPVLSRDFDKIFPTLMDDLVEHAKEYGVPKDTLDWYREVGSSSSPPCTLTNATCCSRLGTTWLEGRRIEGSPSSTLLQTCWGAP